MERIDERSSVAGFDIGLFFLYWHTLHSCCFALSCFDMTMYSVLANVAEPNQNILSVIHTPAHSLLQPNNHLIHPWMTVPKQ